MHVPVKYTSFSSIHFQRLANFASTPSSTRQSPQRPKKRSSELTPTTQPEAAEQDHPITVVGSKHHSHCIQLIACKASQPFKTQAYSHMRSL